MIVLLAAVTATGTIFGIQFFTKTGIFRIPGVVYYDETLKEEEIDYLKSIFTDEVDLDKDVTISAVETFEKPAEEQGHFLYEIYVPVIDFYSIETSVDSAKIYAPETKLIPLSELDSTVKLLSIDNKYFLDEFNTGAVFRSIVFESEAYEKEIEPLVKDSFTKTFPEKETVLTFAQTGVTALSRGMDVKLKNVGMDATYFAQNISD